jgi:hypothetical protein
MRRLGATLLLAGFLFTLVVSVTHDHFDSPRSCASTACILCGGVIATAPDLPKIEKQRTVFVEKTAEPLVPESQYLLRLDHSGCAPPRV